MNKKYLKLSAVLVAILLMVAVFLWAKPTLAAVSVLTGLLTYAVGFITNMFIILFSYFLATGIGILVSIAQYNEFLKAAPVNQGWTVVRDIANMLFVVGLLYIAFQTVFKGSQGSNYQWSKNLLNLVLMAILINFSKFICGLAIDVSQVAMMTFVNAFKDIGAGNLQAILGLDQLQQVYQDESGVTASSTANVSVIAGYIGIIIILIISIITVFAFVLILCWRVIILWILVVLSPAAFALYALDIPKAKSYAKEWVSQFSRYLTVGPLLAFFLWLSFAAFKTTSNATSELFSKTDKTSMDAAKGVMQSAALQPDNIGGLIVVIAFLVGGLAATKKLGVAGGALGSNLVDRGRNAVTSRAKKLAAAPGKLAVGGAKTIAMGTVKAAGSRMELAGGKVGQLARGTRLIATKEGRKTLAERTQARIMSSVGGLPAAKVEQRQKEITKQEELLKLSGVMDDPTKMEEMQKKYEAKGDSMGYLALMNLKSKTGKIKPEDFDTAVKIGAFDHYGKVERSGGKLDVNKMAQTDTGRNALINIEKLTKGWEKSFEDENGYRVPFSPFMRDPDTNEWMVVESGSKGQEKKMKETENSVARAGTEKYSKALNKGDLANMKANTVVESEAMVKGIIKNGRIGLAGDTAKENARKRINEMITAQVGTPEEVENMLNTMADDAKLTGDDRTKFLTDRKNEIQQRRDYFEGKDLAEGDTEGKKKREQEHMDFLNLLQKGARDTTATYEPGSGRVKDEGTVNSQLSAEIEKVKKKPTYQPGTDAVKQNELARKIESIMPDLLESSADLPEAARKEAIKETIDLELGDDKDLVTNMDEVIEFNIKNQQSLMDQSKFKKEIRVDISEQFKSLVSKAKKPGGITPADIRSVMIRLGSEISMAKKSVENKGMSQSYFNLDTLTDLKNGLQTELTAVKDKKGGALGIIDTYAREFEAEGYYQGKEVVRSGGKKNKEQKEEGEDEEKEGAAGAASSPRPVNPPAGGGGSKVLGPSGRLAQEELDERERENRG